MSSSCCIIDQFSLSCQIFCKLCFSEHASSELAGCQVQRKSDALFSQFSVREGEWLISLCLEVVNSGTCLKITVSVT